MNGLASVAFERRDYARSLALLTGDASAADGNLSESHQRRQRHNTMLVEWLTSTPNPATADPAPLLHNLADIDSSDDDVYPGECVVLNYNRAVLHVRLGQFKEAISLLEPLYDIRSQLDLGVVIKISLLLLNIHIRCKSVERATSVLDECNILKGQLQEQGPLLLDSEIRTTPILSVSEFSFWLFLYQTRVMIMTRNEKSAKKTIKSALQILARDSTVNESSANLEYQRASALLVKARLECANDNFTKAIKVLNSVMFSQPSDPRIRSVYMNNMGCIHFAMSKFDASGLYFQKALTWSQDAKDISLTSAIHFNRGVQLLACQSYSAAMKSLLSSTCLLYNTAEVWLHLGDCALQAYVKWRVRDEFVHRVPSHALSHQVPRLILTIPATSVGPPPKLLTDLTRGRAFYRNALRLSKSSFVTQFSQLGLAYIALALGRFSECLTWCDVLRESSGGDLQALVQLYTCEALCRLNRVDDGMTALSKENMAEGLQHKPDWQSFFFNTLCTVYCLQGHFDKGLSCALKSIHCQPNDICSLRSLVFLLLRHRAHNEALYVMYHRSPPPSLLHL